MGESKYIEFRRIVNVSYWDQTTRRDTGSREKYTFIEPGSRKLHVFKRPKREREHQVWSELIASYIAGDLLGWDVQVTRIARQGEHHGNLLEYFYGAEMLGQPGQPGASPEPSRAAEFLIEGHDICRMVDHEYDRERGFQHTLGLLRDVAAYLDENPGKVSGNDFWEYWARAIAFDNLISNTDRHAENWGIVGDKTRSENYCVRMAPLYDNGSSLGCGIDNKGLIKAFDDRGEVTRSHRNRQRDNGRHQFRLDPPDKHRAKFEELGKRFLDVFPSGEKWFRQAANADIGRVDELLSDIQQLPELPAPFVVCDRRQLHIRAMLEIGRERLWSVING